MLPSGVKSLKVVRGVDRLHDMSYIRVDFNVRLQSRGTDFKVYANTGYTANPKDSDLLASIMHRLVAYLPFTSIKVTPYELQMYVNKTVNFDEVMAEITAAARQAGYTVTT